MKLEKKREKNKSNIIRTCVITRANDKKEDLLRFVENSKGEYIYDDAQNIQNRGKYIKDDLEIFQKFFNKFKVEMKSAEKVLKHFEKKVNKENKDEHILRILEGLKNSEYLVYGIDENLDAMKNSIVKLLIIPSDINGKYVNKLKKIAKLNNVNIIFIEKQYSLKKIFLSEVKVVGVKTKKVVRGILNKMEVE
ncbi:DUF448 domain-containing protein [Streptobacillus moniliformis]|nr:DUF448 domain-containing protein [Streptobacillus moniliformis]AVL42401.1 DUF448 domain-containing protein [Streptobacillus moniliformis]SQA13604.1 Protein of uncharacterised function (DUF448) [Streptobacillus moniliformis]